MDIEEGLYKYLSAHAGLTALTSTRIYPDNLPKQPTPPCVVFERISGPRYATMGSRPGMAYPRYKFTAWGATKVSAVSVAAQLIAALDYYTGTMGGAGGVDVDFIMLEDEYDEDPENIIAQRGEYAENQHARCVEFIINHRE